MKKLFNPWVGAVAVEGTTLIITRGSNTFTALKFPRKYPLGLLVKINPLNRERERERESGDRHFYIEGLKKKQPFFEGSQALLARLYGRSSMKIKMYDREEKDA